MRKLFAALFVLSTACATQPALRPSGAAPLERELPTPNGPLFVRVTGSKTAIPIILIHGGPGLSHDYFADLEPLLGADREVASYDQPGVGKTPDRPAAGYTFDAQVADVEALRVGLGADKVILLGHSFGGVLAYAYAAKHPDRLAGLILVDSVPPKLADTSEGFKAFGDRVAQLTKEGRIPKDPPPVTPQGDCRANFLAMWPAYSADPARPVPEALRRMACSDGAGNKTFAAFGNFDFSGALGAVSAPTLVLFGDRDAFGEGWGRASVAALGGGHPSLVVIPNAAHFPWVDQPEKVKAALQGFLAR